MPWIDVDGEPVHVVLSRKNGAIELKDADKVAIADVVRCLRQRETNEHEPRVKKASGEDSRDIVRDLVRDRLRLGATVSNERGSGRSSLQMMGAPRNAVYIWCNSMFGYPKDLARRFHRTDMRIVSPSWLTVSNLGGADNLSIVIDHAAQLNAAQWESYMFWKQRKEARGG